MASRWKSNATGHFAHNDNYAIKETLSTKQYPWHITKWADFTNQNNIMNWHTRNSRWTRSWVYKSTDSSSKMVGYWQSLRLSMAPLKLTQVSTMVESPQFGAQKATGSFYRAYDWWQKVSTNTSDSQSEQRATLAVKFINKVLTLGLSLAIWPDQVFGKIKS